MKLKAILVMGLVVVFCSMPGWAAQEEQNIVTNPGFELGNEGWSPRLHEGSADNVEFLIAEDLVRTGQRSSAIVSTHYGVRAKWAYTFTPELGVLKKGDTFHAEVWYRSEDMAYGTPGVAARLTSSTQGWTAYQDVMLKPVLEKEGWTLLSGTLTLTLDQPWNLMLELFNWKATGTVWFDDAKIVSQTN